MCMHIRDIARRLPIIAKMIPSKRFPMPKTFHFHDVMLGGMSGKSHIEWTEFTWNPDEELPDMADVPIVAACGDIWQLGRHRLICGDSRDAKTYERLLGERKADKHELIFVFKNGSKPHINNFEMGDHGRFRTNIWDYPSSSSFYKDAVTGETRDQLIKLHPTLCPVQMLVDMMMDCSKRNQLILDPFCGSGPSLIAAEKTGRCTYAIEYEPKFVNAAIYRWEKFTGEKAVKTPS